VLPETVPAPDTGCAAEPAPVCSPLEAQSAAAEAIAAVVAGAPPAAAEGSGC